MLVTVDWPFYRDVYGGDEIEEAAHPQWMRRAALMLDALTFGRIDSIYAASDTVKMACCAVAETMHEDAQGHLSRERLGDYEVAYSGVRATRSLTQRCRDAAHVYLWRSGLLRMAVQCG